MMWKYYAVLSALFAALTAIFAKIGVKDFNFNLATAIRTTVILLLTWDIVLFNSAVCQPPHYGANVTDRQINTQIRSFLRSYRRFFLKTES